MIMLVVEFVVASENRADFESVMDGLAASTLANEEGALLYQLAVMDDKPGQYRLVELYRDQAAVDEHMGSTWFRAAGKAMMPLLDGRPEISRHTGVNDSFAQKAI